MPALTPAPLQLSPDGHEFLAKLTLELLRDLVRLDTTNPPGNELLAARYLSERLAAAGLPSEIIEPAPGRASVICRMSSGTDEGRGHGLLLLSHLDVVGAEPEQWQVPPFSGVIHDGQVWGRGTLDTKGLTAMQAAIMILLKKLDVELRRDVVLAATADEESDGTWGARWLVDNRPELITATAAINEGGGMGIRLGGGLVYLVQTAEKATCPVTVTARGEPGHASLPLPDNAVVSLSRALVAIGSRRLPVHITPTYRQFVELLAARLGGARGAVARQLLQPRLADSIIDRMGGGSVKSSAMRAMIRNTATPTVVNAGYRLNVIPGQVQAKLDCRLLPGYGASDILAELTTVLEQANLAKGITLEATPMQAPATESPFDHKLVKHMAAAIASHADGAPLVPYLVPAATDARYLRPMGMAVYGFTPMLPDEATGGAHGHNERISLASLRFGAKVLWDVVSSYCSV